MFSTKTSLIMANFTFKLIHFFVLLEPSFSFRKIIMYLVNLFSLSPSSLLPHESTIRFLWILPKIIPRESKCESDLFFILFFWIAAEYSLVCVYKKWGYWVEAGVDLHFLQCQTVFHSVQYFTLLPAVYDAPCYSTFLLIF